VTRHCINLCLTLTFFCSTGPVFCGYPLDATSQSVTHESVRDLDMHLVAELTMMIQKLSLHVAISFGRSIIFAVSLEILSHRTTGVCLYIISIGLLQLTSFLFTCIDYLTATVCDECSSTCCSGCSSS